jgi:hypothetical protein
MTPAVLLLLLTPASDPRTAPTTEHTFVLSKFTPAEALRLDGKRARFRIASTRWRTSGTAMSATTVSPRTTSPGRCCSTTARRSTTR